MHIRTLLILLAGFFACESVQAQDIHFTQYNMTPLTLNPGNTGKFEGTARIGGIYRSQWTSIADTKGYGTPGLYVDAPIIRGFRKRDWVGLGANFNADQAGTLTIKRSSFALSGAYHLALDRKGNTYLSIGGQYGSESRKLGGESRFEDQILNPTSGGSADPYAMGDPKANFSDINGGVTLSSRLNTRMDMTLGFAMFHIGEPNYSLIGGSKWPRRSVLHGQFNAALTDKWSMSPSFMYQTMAGFDEIMLQGLAGYLLNPEKDITLHFGLGYRLRDAVNALLGMQYKDLRVGLAYDINTSDLNNATNYRGGFEIAANYIIKIYKPAKIEPKILCPRF
jgi:type IX secretion system PorP/SprF family membrane protein